MSQWKTKELRELYKQWEEKLKQSGFEDAEQTIGNERVLKQFSTNFSRNEPIEQTLARGRYYDLLRHRLTSVRFSNGIHRYVMHRVVDGAKNSEIHKELLAKGNPVNIHTVYLIIRRYEHKWGIRKWTAKELGLKRLPRIRSYTSKE